jgi:hypothetical protein
VGHFPRAEIRGDLAGFTAGYLVLMLRTTKQQRNNAMYTRKSLASPEQIRSFIEKEYPAFAGCEMSIGLLGGIYRVMVKDQAHVWHTIHIPLKALP